MSGVAERKQIFHVANHIGMSLGQKLDGLPVEEIRRRADRLDKPDVNSKHAAPSAAEGEERTGWRRRVGCPTAIKGASK